MLLASSCEKILVSFCEEMLLVRFCVDLDVTGEFLPHRKSTITKFSSFLEEILMKRKVNGAIL